jgi:methylthioribose-1-phosphate isomerase
MAEATTERIESGIIPIKYEGGKVWLLDQRILPQEVAWFDATALDDMCLAITDMVVRGAPSIGVAAAFGLALEASRLSCGSSSDSAFLQGLQVARDALQATRPTAVNLRWATEEIYNFIYRELLTAQKNDLTGLPQVAQRSIAKAQQILDDLIASNKRLSEFGAEIVPANASIITHCNAGPLATCGWGTALGVVRAAWLNGKQPHVYVDETRPRNQGAKLTMWELSQDGIASTLICDSMSGHVMNKNKIDLVVVGADRIATNGDTANKIGTYNLAVVARFHQVPFYIAAPLSTIDPKIASGKEIPIEERSPLEMTTFAGQPTTIADARVYNPAFDVTPADLITGIITEVGILTPPYNRSIVEALARQK